MPADRLFGIGVCALSLAFLLFGVPTISDDWQHTVGAQYFTVGPRLFPYIAGSLCLLFGAMIALRPQAASPMPFFLEGGARTRVLLLMGLSIAYAALLDLLGFVLGSMLMLAVFMTGFGVRRRSVIVAVALGLPLLTDFVFARLLILELPPGRIELPF